MGKKERKSKKNSKHNSNVTKLYFGVGGILVAILVGLILFNSGIFEEAHDISKFSIDDECSIIMGNLIHNIRDGGDCKIKCVNNCEIRELDFYDSEFTFENSSCHTCDCYCK
ncbi:hypothetical protein KAS08_04295 [Candidatus Pacearchaeota archaeon]|nr:hypothetical protein [Candidatus Pacearchaeota archaeon]